VFYDRMFGWLGYASFWTLDVGYRSTYYMTTPPLPHSYIGIQPASSGEPVKHREHRSGIHHVALWARSKREVDRFHQEFLIREQVTVTYPPAAYPAYAPGYYAVFFLDPSGIRWELAFTPRVPMPWDIARTARAARALRRQHPEWKRHPAFEMWRKLPRK
jgi:catechol 2,3-dioxygenase-like lactoylglutathione lyase family enzyme